MFYTGIGSRKTPEDILKWMRIYAHAFAKLGLTLRSGAAPGADSAFEEGCDRDGGPKEIYLPWKNFQKSDSELIGVPDEAMEIADAIYPDGAFKYLKRPVKLLMARDCLQVTGLTLDIPSKFVLCWTPDGCSSQEERTKKSGGTGQAIAYASSLGIPIFNLQREGKEEEFLQYLNEEFGEIEIREST